MDFQVLASTFALLFVAEMGDKTQLMAMTLAHRYPPRPVIAGVLLAFLVLDLAAVLLGDALSGLLPRHLLLLVAAALFLFFAWRSWVASGEEEEEETGLDSRHVLLASFSLIFVAELGDKTQLTLIALAAGSDDLWAVFIGGTLALWAVSLLGILAGAKLLRHLPREWVHRASALLFTLFGLWALFEAWAAVG
ncbi:MAG TPA: TMEM165/GDT1 family protein [Sedimenticola sp.]|nr:TMEM165/GDT1 family protein [Sedimenticola sp.]